MRPFACVIFAAAVGVLTAQQVIPTPHVGYVYPAGGRPGATFEVTVGGQYLDGVNTVFVSGTGVEAKIVKHVKPMNAMAFQDLRKEAQELAKKRMSGGKWTAEDEKKGAELKDKMENAIIRPASPSIGELVRVQITMAADASPGERELRLGTGMGVTNPLVFCVGQAPEVSKPAAKVESAFKQQVQQQYRDRFNAGPPKPPGPATITLPVTVNGQILPGGVDRYKFQATKGQQLVAVADTRKLIPYISDAVPGWFQASLALYDSKGKEVEYADHFLFNQDPVLHYEVPADGEYVLAIHDSIYRGREDFVYRITVGELPFITSIFPLGGRVGAKTNIALKGWNLPVATLTESGQTKGRAVYPISVRKGEMLSNPVPFSMDTLPEVMEKEPNNAIKKAQKIKIPMIVNGRIDRPDDLDVFRFEGHAGEEIVAEVFARRLDSPLDSTLKLTDAAGKVLAANDDFDDKAAGLITHQADSRIQFKLPANGAYYLHLGDSQHKGGADYAYRLHVTHPHPDFELRVTPASISARSSAVPITVYAVRRDGFAGDIALSLKNAPPGFALNGGTIPGNQDKVRLTLTVPLTREYKPLKLAMEGRAIVDGNETVRTAIPAEYMEQAFAYHHLVPKDEWVVRSTPSRTRSAVWKVMADKPVQLPPGGTGTVQLSIPIGQYVSALSVQLNEPPEGITIQSTTPRQDGIVIVLRADAAKVKPGLRGNLIVDGYFERPETPGQPSRPRQQRIQPIGTLPAIPFEVVGTVQARK